ncbi:MAG: signal peptidase I, partial [Lachnospiraceae bacterium]|nr:signal peptidase I [Lachnospiraceae bacterium]
LKRVVGLPGERIQIIGGYLYINGEPLEEGETYDKIVDAGIAENEILLENDEYFVMGDNRNVSEDSRSGNIGPVSKSMITGRAWFRFGIGGESMGLIK